MYMYYVYNVLFVTTRNNSYLMYVCIYNCCCSQILTQKSCEEVCTYKTRTCIRLNTCTVKISIKPVSTIRKCVPLWSQATCIDLQGGREKDKSRFGFLRDAGMCSISPQQQHQTYLNLTPIIRIKSKAAGDAKRGEGFQNVYVD